MRKSIAGKIVHNAALALVVTASLATAGCLNALNVTLFPPSAPLSEVVISGQGRDKVLILPVQGVITAFPGSSTMGRKTDSTLAYITAQLDAARKDKRIKAVVLKIDSPGGQVAACDAIYEELTRFKQETNVAIVAQQVSLAASGGYYLSMVADRVLAQPTTVTGSVGVIMMKLDAGGLLTKIGVRDDSVKSGESKDLLSIFKQMTPSEREILTRIMDTMHKKFISVVTESRKDVVDPATAFDGRVFIAQDALERNLVDRIGYLPDSIEEAKKLAGLKEATVIRFAPGKNVSLNAYSDAGAESGVSSASAGLEPVSLKLPFMVDAGPQFLYIWGM
ncbi:MAG: signal peptide peptidase SppA [Nitrospinota bacterium]|nr:signal peptide peptidase SppA [Nitrospinota bacterium]